MKRIMLVLMMCLLVVGMAGAVTQPSDGIQVFSTIDQPIPPSGTDTDGVCTPWEQKNEECIGDVMHYDKCLESPDGSGRWMHYTLNCKDYGSMVSCISGECVRESSLFPTSTPLDWKTIGIIAGIIFILVIIFKKK